MHRIEKNTCALKLFEKNNWAGAPVVYMSVLVGKEQGCGNTFHEK